MADIRISELADLQNVEDEDILVINDVSAQTTKRITRERFLVGTTQNVYDSGDNAIAKQDLTVNNDLIVGGDIHTTGEVSFGSLTDVISGVTAHKFSTISDGIENNNSDGSIPTSGAVASYLNYFLDNLYDSATIPTTINDLIDVTIASPIENQVLTYDGSKWINASPTSGGSTIYDLNDLDDVVIAGVSEGQVLKFSNGYWINADDSGATTTLSQLNDVVTAGVEIDDIARQAATTLLVSPFGTSSYRFDQYGTEDNPNLIFKAGTTVAFDLDSATSHPFLILKNSTNFNTGLIHVDDDGTVSTGASAQGKNSGTLYWKIPGEGEGNYSYLCSVHASMNGTIEVTPAKGNLNSRDTFNITTGSIPAGDSADVNIEIYKSYALMKVQVDRPAWIRIYTDAASRDADVGRTQDSAAASGLVTEIITTAPETVNLAPAPIGFNNESPVTNVIPMKVVNLSGLSNTVDITLTALKLEA